MNRKYILAMILFVMTFIILDKPVLVKTYAMQDIEINSKSSLLMDFASGEVVLEQNSDAKLPIASMVKLMTLLLSYEAIERGDFTIDTLIQTSQNASNMGGSQVFIDAFVEYSVNDLLKSIIMASANDASVAMAEKISGSEESFVILMNKRAKELNMNNTLYANSTGLPAPEQYSCAKDCAIILKALYKYPHYLSWSNVWMDELTHPSGRKTELVNTNKLVRYYKGCDGGKTGSTSEAGFCLTASASKNDLRFIGVVIGAKDGQTRFAEMSKLFNYGFANYQNINIVDEKVSLANVQVVRGKINSSEVFAKEQFTALIKKGDKTDYKTIIDLPEKIVAPQKNEATVGKIFVTKNGEVIKEIDIVIKQELKTITYFESLKKVANNWK